MPLPKIPRLEKFCFCMDVHTGVKSFSLCLIILWVLYAIGAFIGTNSSVGEIFNLYSIIIYHFVQEMESGQLSGVFVMLLPMFWSYLL